MPTFRNDTERAIIYRGTVQPPNGKTQEIIIIFDPKQEVAINFWIPYERLGLELVNESYPPVPDTLLLSGTFKFYDGTERKYMIEPCDRYTVDVILQKGGMKIYAGSSPTGAEIHAEVEAPYRYSAEYDWEYAPYLRVLGLEDDTEAVIHAEVKRRSY